MQALANNRRRRAASSCPTKLAAECVSGNDALRSTDRSRNGKTERGAGPPGDRGRPEADASSMFLDQLFRNPQAQTGANVGLRGVEWLEDALDGAQGYTGAVVGD